MLVQACSLNRDISVQSRTIEPAEEVHFAFLDAQQCVSTQLKSLDMARWLFSYQPYNHLAIKYQIRDHSSSSPSPSPSSPSSSSNSSSALMILSKPSISISSVNLSESFDLSISFLISSSSGVFSSLA